MAIYVTGDTHGSQRHGMSSFDGYMHRLSTSSFPEQRGLGKEDYVVILGDFGGVWGNGRPDNYYLNKLNRRNFTTLWIDGNHGATRC